MRERFDFSSISKIILDNSKRDSFRKEYFYTIFDYAFSKGISVTDESNISRILNGERNVPRSIVNLYQRKNELEYLKEDVSAVLEEVLDVPKMKEQIYQLLMNDMSLSAESKKELYETKENDLLFLTNCIVTSISRSHIKRKKDGNSYLPVKKLDLSDYLLDYHYPRCNKYFFGRDAELKDIHERLSTEKCLFLHGIGGIGKSELAKQYGEEFKKGYSNILYLHYTKSLYQTIYELGFLDDSGDMSQQELFEMHYRFFKQLDGNALVILDNFNMQLEEDDLLLNFLSMSFKLLITTRSKIDEFARYPVKEIESMDALQELFYAYTPKGKNAPDIIQKIIEEVHRHTLTVEIAAKTMRASDLEPEELLESLRKDRLNLSDKNKVSIQKDASTKKATPKEHLVRLFQLQQLSEEHKTILQHIRLIPNSGIQKRLFCKWLDASDFNMVNELIGYGWVQEEEKTCRISIHPFLNEALSIFGEPSFRNCQQFMENLGQEYVVEVEKEIYYRDLLNLTRSIFQTIVIDDTSMAFSLLEKILAYTEKYVYQNTMRYILELFKEIIPMGAEDKLEMATYKFYRGVEAFARGEWETAEKCFKDGISILESFDASNAGLAMNLHYRLSMYYMFCNNQELFQRHMNIAIELGELYGLDAPIDYEFKNTLLALMSKSGDMIEPDEILEIPEVKSFFQHVKDSGKLSQSSGEFLKDLEKVEPKELEEKETKLIIENITDDLKELVSTKQEIAVTDVLTEIINMAQKYVKENDLFH